MLLQVVAQVIQVLSQIQKQIHQILVLQQMIHFYQSLAFISKSDLII